MPPRKSRDDNRTRDDDHDREPYAEEGTAVQIHQAYLEQRLAGGEEPTPEAYRRAVEQFQRLPGATGAPPARPAVPPRPEPTDAADGEPDNGEDAEGGQ
jgi:hypothetical protein